MLRKDDFLTPAEVAELTRVSTKTLANWRSKPPENPLPFRKWGGRIYYLRSEVEAWLQAGRFVETRRPISPQPKKKPRGPGEDIAAKCVAIAKERDWCWARISELNAQEELINPLKF